MILYYAMGGGLGHLTRSIAILKNAPDLCASVRLMTSSRLAPMVLPMLPCPMDVVDDVTLSSRKRYYRFLNTYISTYRIKAIVLDTFPCGIIGEWEHVARRIPRILIARYLNLSTYFKRVDIQSFVSPAFVLCIEPLQSEYSDILHKNSRVKVLDAPITLATQASFGNKYVKDKWLIVHSGAEAENKALIKLAKEKMQQLETQHIHIETCFKEDSIYPAERIIPKYSVIIGGAGYNMVSIACTGSKNQAYVLHPFKRKFDDQFLRLDKFQKGEWLKGGKNGAEDAGKFLTEIVDFL